MIVAYGKWKKKCKYKYLVWRCGVVVTMIEWKTAETQRHSSGDGHVRFGERWPQYRWWKLEIVHIRAPARRKPRSPPKTAARRRRRRARTERPPQQVAAGGARETASSPNPAADHLSLVEFVCCPLPIDPLPPLTLDVWFDLAAITTYPSEKKGFLIFVLKVHSHRAAGDDPTTVYAVGFGWFFSWADRIISNRVRLNLHCVIVFKNCPAHIVHVMGKRHTWAEKDNIRTTLPVTTPDEVCSRTTPLDISRAFTCFSL